MTRPWFRMYREILGSPKVQRLKPEVFKAWVNILCCTEDDGSLPNNEDLAFMLRVPEIKAKEYVLALKSANLLDARNGAFYAHDWDEHQYASDVSTGRVKRFRKRFNTVSEASDETQLKRSGNVSETAPDTDTEQNRAEQTRNVSRTPIKKQSRLDKLLEPMKQEEARQNGKY